MCITEIGREILLHAGVLRVLGSGWVSEEKPKSRDMHDLYGRGPAARLGGVDSKESCA